MLVGFTAHAKYFIWTNYRSASLYGTEQSKRKNYGADLDTTLLNNKPNAYISYIEIEYSCAHLFKENQISAKK